MQLPDMTLLAPLVALRALSLAMNRLGPVPLGGVVGEPAGDTFQVGRGHHIWYMFWLQVFVSCVS